MSHPGSSRTFLRRWRWLVLVGAAAATAAVAASVAGGTSAAPHRAAAKCPFPGGQIKIFSSFDIAGATGDLGQGTYRGARLWLALTNAKGGILGCKVVMDAKDEGFPDVDVCLRAYKEAILSRKYDFYMGSTGSGCMASLPALTSAAGKAIIANQAADHQPFFERFSRLNLHAAVSTFLEGRASAKFAAQKGWKRIGVIAPNYAYGQDAAKAFKQYFLQLVPDGKIVVEQFPEFNEKNFTPFINAIVAEKPDAVFSAFFGGFVLPFWKQWKEGGHENIPTISGLIDLVGWELVKSPGQIPKNTYAYDRGVYQLEKNNPVGREYYNAYVAKYGKSAHPLPNAWGFAWVSGLQMAKALIEKTRSLDPQAWVKTVETGTFSFLSPYSAKPIYVNPVNHMADTCAQVGLLGWNPKLPVPASYVGKISNICMRDILAQKEVKKLTKNPGVSDAALSAYYKRAGK